MNFGKLIENAKDEAAKKKAFDGFAIRQSERDKKFNEQAWSREPSYDWYNLMYGKRK